MAMLPFQPTPFFEDKNRAFWRLQLIGWTGAFIYRAATVISNDRGPYYLILVLVSAIAGFSISLILSVIYSSLINRKPYVTWSVTAIVLASAVALSSFINAWTFSVYEAALIPKANAGGEETSFLNLMFGLVYLDSALLGAWSALYYAINYFLQVEEQTDRLERLGAQATSAQLAMLRYQLNPHFLFNTLNSISTLVLLKQTEPANAMLTRLSGFLRHTLVTEPGAKVTVAQEVETLQLYLEIERMRFEERLQTEFTVDPRASEALIPSMLLQPLIENAIKYGVSKQEEGARITLAAQVIGAHLRVTVSDTGPGIQNLSYSPHDLTKRPSSTGVGLANIAERLAQGYGDNHRFDIETPAEGGFTVIVELPYELDDEEQGTAPALGKSPMARPLTGQSPKPDPAHAARANAIGTTA